MICNVIGPEAGSHLKPIWGLDAEGEMQGAMRDIGLPRLWCMIGTPVTWYEGQKTILNQTQGTLPCADSTRSTLLCVRFFLFVHDRSTLTDNMSFSTEIKAIEEGLFDEKRYSLETPSE